MDTSFNKIKSKLKMENIIIYIFELEIKAVLPFLIHNAFVDVFKH